MPDTKRPQLHFLTFGHFYIFEVSEQMRIFWPNSNFLIFVFYRIKNEMYVKRPHRQCIWGLLTYKLGDEAFWESSNNVFQKASTFLKIWHFGSLQINIPKGLNSFEDRAFWKSSNMYSKRPQLFGNLQINIPKGLNNFFEDKAFWKSSNIYFLVLTCFFIFLLIIPPGEGGGR